MSGLHLYLGRSIQEGLLLKVRIRILFPEKANNYISFLFWGSLSLALGGFGSIPINQPVMESLSFCPIFVMPSTGLAVSTKTA